MKKLIIYSIFSLLTGLILSQCSKNDEDVVVSIEDRVITIKNIQEILKANYPKKDNYQDIDLDHKKELLEPLINKNLRIYAAYDLGLDKDKDFQKKLKDFELRLMGSKYYEEKIIDELVPEREIEKFLERQGVELKASHILIGFKGSRRPAERTKDEAIKLVNDIIKELNAGADFGMTAIKYSDDLSAKKNKGELGYFTWGRMVGPFQEAAWNLDVGQISGPVETPFGFHIIKLEDRREIPNYKPDRSPRSILRIKQTLAKAHNDSVKVRWVKHYAGLKKKYNYVLYDDSLKYLSNLISEKMKVEKLIAGSFTSAQKEITLAEYNGGKITLGYFIDKYGKKLASVLSRFKDYLILKQEIDRDSMNRLVMKAVKEIGIDQQPDIIKEIKKFSDAQMNKMIEKQQVTETTNPTDQDLLKYYKLNRDSFKKGKEIELWEIYVTDKNLAEKIAQKAKKGINFENLVEKYSEDKTAKNKNGYIGFKSINGRGNVSREAHKLGPGGKIGGPLKYRRGWVVFKTGKENAERFLPYEEVKKEVKNKLTRELTSQAKTAWQNSLKEKYSVYIDEEKLREI
jgi:peptidyl-prolyl cis-trans isomerase SurA